MSLNADSFSGVSVPQASSTLLVVNQLLWNLFQWCISSTGLFNLVYRVEMLWMIVSVVYQFHRPLQQTTSEMRRKLKVSVVYQFHRPLQLKATSGDQSFESFSGVSVPQASSTKKGDEKNLT